MSSALFLDGARQLQDAPVQAGQVSGQQGVKDFAISADGSAWASGATLVACTHNKQAETKELCK